MYISRITHEATYVLDLNEVEYKVMRKIIDKLVFNPEGVSNQFKIPTEEVEILNQIRNGLNFKR